MATLLKLEFILNRNMPHILQNYKPEQISNLTEEILCQISEENKKFTASALMDDKRVIFISKNF